MSEQPGSEQHGPERLAVLVHEVRSPVAALTALEQTLAAGGPHPRREIVSLAARACRVIERLLCDASVASVRRETFGAAGLLREAATPAVLGGARIRVDAPEALRLEADPTRIRQVLDNLIANAIAHSPAGAEIVLAASEGGDGVALSVSDAGPGVPPEWRERIFEAGERFDASYPGTGLGLAVSRAIVEAHGGRLMVDSRPGEGTTFTLVLPRLAPEPRGRSER